MPAGNIGACWPAPGGATTRPGACRPRCRRAWPRPSASASTPTRWRSQSSGGAAPRPPTRVLGRILRPGWGLHGPAPHGINTKGPAVTTYAAACRRGRRKGGRRRAGHAPWQQVRDGLPPMEGTTVAVLAATPSEPGVFYAASNRGIYRSADAGITWGRLGAEWPARYQDQRVEALVVTG